jgi:phosphatidylglycerophosphatase A
MNLRTTYTAVATVFGVGRFPFAPGTAASILALPVAWLIATAGGSWGRVWLLMAAIFVNALGCWACELYAHETQVKDPSECVIDEVAGQWIVCAFAPSTSLYAYAVAFLLFRMFDILKPWPISAAERLPGGLGIMADDFVAGLMAAAIIAVLAHLTLVW